VAQFRYQAVNRTGKKLRGTIEAVDQSAAVSELRKSGLYPTKLIAAAGKSIFRQELHLGFLSDRRVKLQDIVPFCRQFATLVRAGVSLNKSLEVLIAQTGNKTLKQALQHVQDDVRQGISLQEAFSKHPKVFPEMFVNMVGAGEYSGQLETMLERLAVFFERQHATSQKMVSALTYPFTVFIIAIGVSIFLLVSVVPNLAQTFAEQGVNLPLPTRIVLGISHFLVDQWYLALGIGLAIVLTAGSFIRSDRGQLFWDTWILRIPVFGTLYRKGVLARFARTFSTLEGSSVPILEVLDLIKRVIGNRLFDQALTEAQQNLRKGERISEALDNHPILFPAIVTQMVAIGEETGEMESLMGNLADFYEAEVIEMSSRLSSLLEPLMIMFLAGIVGMIILSVYLPMFTMMNFVR
jgi:type IV pilus assembly protein PilC